MKANVRRLLLVCGIVGLAAAVMVAAGSAKPRDPTVVVATFAALPGPGQVTYGENIAYRATLENKSGTTLTQVKFRQRYPEITRSGKPAQPLAGPVSSNCAQWGGTTSTATVTVNGAQKTEWICNLGQQSATAPKISLTVVWNVPVPSDPAEAAANCENCLSSFGYWTTKEGGNDTTDPNDTFGATTVPATLLANQSGASEKQKAGGYETGAASCADTEAPGSLRTNPALGVGNFVSTTICLPAFTLTAEQQKVGLGFAATITEPANNARSSDVCIAALGFSCDDDSAPEANFGDADVVHIFHVAADGLPKNYDITTITHNGEVLELCSAPGAEADPDGCVVQIIPPKGNPKIWIIVAKSPTNGLWGW